MYLQKVYHTYLRKCYSHHSSWPNGHFFSLLFIFINFLSQLIRNKSGHLASKPQIMHTSDIIQSFYMFQNIKQCYFIYICRFLLAIFVFQKWAKSGHLASKLLKNGHLSYFQTLPVRLSTNITLF